MDRVIINYKPWKHLEIENFLPPKQLKYVKNIFNHITDNNRRMIINDKNLEKFANSIYPRLCNFLNKGHFQKCDMLYQYNNFDNASSNIHVDQAYKHITVVCQLSPEANGTAIYNANKEYVKTTDWKYNNAVVLPNHKDNWHDVHTYSNQQRITLNIIYCKLGLIPEEVKKEYENG